MFLLCCLVGLASALVNVRAVHGIPNTPVDVYVNGALTFENFVYEQTRTATVASGSYVVAIRPHNALATSNPLLSLTAVLTDGEDVDLVAFLDAAGTPQLKPFFNDVSCLDHGFGRLTVRHTAQAGPVNVFAGASKIISDLANGAEAKLVLPAATYENVQVRTVTGDALAIGPVSITLTNGNHKVIYAVGSATLGVVIHDTAVCASPACVTVRIIHGVPGAVVDVYVDGVKTLANFQYGSVIDPLALPPGTYVVAIHPAGSATVLVSATLTFAANDNKDVIAHLTSGGALTASVFSNNLACLPNRNGRIAVRHTAAADEVDVYSGNTAVISALANGGWRDLGPLPAAVYDVRVNKAGSQDVAIPTTAVRLTNRKLVVVYAVGSAAAGYRFITYELSGICKIAGSK